MSKKKNKPLEIRLRRFSDMSDGWSVWKRSNWCFEKENNREPKFAVCGWGLAEYFDIPEDAKFIWVIFHKTPGKNRLKVCFKMSPSGSVDFEIVEKNEFECSFLYAHTWLKKKGLQDKTRYVQVDYQC